MIRQLEGPFPAPYMAATRATEVWLTEEAESAKSLDETRFVMITYFDSEGRRIGEEHAELLPD